MTKRPLPGKCVYCLEMYDDLTWDHVFPSSWYPDSTPDTMPKWKVPCCNDCNNIYSRIEENIRLRLGICLNTHDKKAQGIPEKSLRSITPECAQNERERDIRQRKREKIKGEIAQCDAIPEKGILPGFGKRPGVATAPYASIPISPNELKAFGKKLVRGATYALDEAFIENDYDITVEFPEQANVKFFSNLAKRCGTLYCVGPGLEIQRAKAEENPKNAMFVIEIWGQLRIYATVIKK